ncbi:hypothetical protein ACWIGI_10575 [Nocardia sp. NPDC055321]
MNKGVFDDGWDHEPPRERTSATHESAWEADGHEPDSIDSPYVTMQLDSGLLPVRLEFHADWSQQVAPSAAGRELFTAYQAAVVRQHRQNIENRGGWKHGRSTHPGATPRRKQLELLLDATTREQYVEVLRLIGSLGDYTADGPTSEYDDPVLTIRANRFSITSFSVVPQWVAHAEHWALETEILTCTETIRAMRPVPTVRGDYARYTDAELEAWNQQHYQRLIAQRKAS